MPEYIEDKDGAPIVEPEVLGKLIGFVREQGGHFMFAYDETEDNWLVGVEFGREAENSSMSAGASYHMSQSLPEAVRLVSEECGL